MLQRIGNDVKVQLGLLMVVVSRDKVAIGCESVRHVMSQLMLGSNSDVYIVNDVKASSSSTLIASDLYLECLEYE